MGPRCPVWGPGPFSALPPGGAIRLDGPALRSALRDALPKLRGAAWGQMCTAPLPPEAGEEPDSPRARAVLVGGRYSLGLPLDRLEGSPARRGVPIPAATQWDPIEQVGDCGSGVLELRETLAAPGARLPQDATSVRSGTLSKEHQPMRAPAAAQGVSRPQERPGMVPTAVVVKRGERLLGLSSAGRAPAGENRAALGEKREAEPPPPRVRSDALARHEVEEGVGIGCPCLAHGRRQCSALEAVFPRACRVVSEALQQGLDQEAEARDQPMSPPARLASPQASSQPLRDDLQAWLALQGADRLVEPHRALGQALASMPTHGETLPRFVSVAGAPRDHNGVERAWQRFLRPRQHALCSTTDSSASIARGLPSLIAPGLSAGMQVLDSLVALQAHRAEGVADPAAWWPWPAQAPRAPPEAPRRPACAMWARSGSPCHSRMIKARADRGPCASAGVGHQGQRPGDNRFLQSQEPGPS